MKQFEKPEISIHPYALLDILTASETTIEETTTVAPPTEFSPELPPDIL